MTCSFLSSVCNAGLTDLGGIIPTETETFTFKDTKTARKFGKSWILGAQKSHLTIRIGPQAAAHMAERTARLEFERQTLEARNGPVRHWVSEHDGTTEAAKSFWSKGITGAKHLTPICRHGCGPKREEFEFDLPEVVRSKSE